MKRRSRLTRDQVVKLHAGQSILIVLASCPHVGSWGYINKVIVPAAGERVFEVEDHRGETLFVGVDSITEIGRHIRQ